MAIRFSPGTESYYIPCSGSASNLLLLLAKPSYPARFDKVLILVDVTVLYIVYLGIDNTRSFVRGLPPLDQEVH